MYNKQMIYNINNKMVIVGFELFAKESARQHDHNKHIKDNK